MEPSEPVAFTGKFRRPCDRRDLCKRATIVPLIDKIARFPSPNGSPAEATAVQQCVQPIQLRSFSDRLLSKISQLIA